ncbi:hypothetical protein LTR99_002077 [Exophiala xenobiotica]|nr:hypothetical protein LTR96_002315 [Exophiala xenobiotica]KAK5306386.1 hypothetical protein LTR99_002077 [Exophiala xenobiotica]KAK5329834.1 hypothetical protein LTR93_001422 [Exophiala xenobiotica]KAK5416771.1 hypothetical protein LTR06_002757 [Exophiala xenobiotica]
MPFNQSPSKAQSVLDFARHLQRLLSKDANVSSQTISDTLSYIQALPLPRRDVTPSQRIEFDRFGVSLWNTCCKLGKSDGRAQDVKDLATIRAFSYFLVESAASSKGKSIIRLIKHALKASKTCLDVGLHDLGSRIVEQLASKQEDLTQIKQEHGCDEEHLINSLRWEYLLLRIALGRKQSRLELADHFYAQLCDAQPKVGPEIVAKLVDLCYEIGNDHLGRNQSDVAAKWLERGCQLSDQSGADSGDTDVHELRLTLLHTYVRAVLSVPDAAAREEGCKAMQTLREEFGHKLCVIVLQLEIYRRDESPDVGAYCHELMKLIRTSHLILSNHKLIMHYIFHLKSMSINDAIEAIVTYITTRLAPGEESAWTDSAIVTLVWMITLSQAQDSSSFHHHATSRFNKIQTAGRMSVGPEAARAALVLLWKKVEDAFENGPKEDMIKWSQVALHALFRNVEDQNAAKVQRKVMQCYMDLSDFEGASRTWKSMSESEKQHPLSQYVHYCLALRKGDEVEVRSALASLAAVHDNRNRLLFAAVSEAFHHGTKAQAAQLLQRIIDKYGDKLPPEVDPYALLRCTARLLITAIAESKSIEEELLSRVCGVFKSGKMKPRNYQLSLTGPASNLSQKHAAGNGQYLQEFRWFQNTAYNCAVRNFKSWPARYLIDLLQYSCRITYPPNSPESALLEKLIHETDVAFVQAALYTTEARSCSASWTIEDLPRTSYSSKSPPTSGEIRRTLYRNVFDNYTEFQSRLKQLQQDWPSRAEDSSQKVAAIAPLAFEAVLFVTASGESPVDAVSLNLILDEAIQLQPTKKTYSCLADMILSSAGAATRVDGQQEQGHMSPQLSISTATQLLAKLIQGLRVQSDYDTAQAFRWIRCVVQVVLDRCGADSKLSAAEYEKGLITVKTITEQALALGRSALPPVVNGTDKGQSQQAYPSEELEWLATTLFNLAIDLYVAETESGCATEGLEDHAPDEGAPSTSIRRPQIWAVKAVEFAGLLAESVLLERTDRNEAVATGGDGGMLVSLLRERCRSIGWDV